MPGSLQMEMHFNLYNKGLESLRNKEIHLEIDHKYIDSLRSISIAGLSSKIDNEKLKFKLKHNSTSLYEFTLPDLIGRQKKKLVIVLRTN